MNRWHPFRELVLARLREFYREPVALYWVYGFPLILAIGLGIAFSSRKPDPPDIDVEEVADEQLWKEIVEHLEKEQLKAHHFGKEECARRLKTGKSMIYLVPGREGDDLKIEYVFDEARPESVSARHQVESALHRRLEKSPKWQAEEKIVSEPGSRYIDFLMPGLIGMNLMGGGLWGVGFVLVDMRVRKLMKRLLATPMRRGDFLLSILSARQILVIPDMLVLVLVSVLLFRVPLAGNPLLLIALILIGGFAFAGIGLLIACRTDKTETVSGLMNLVMLPQWLLSGTFFSAARFPDVSQPFVQALPLTQLNNALREVMIDGAGFQQVGWRLGILALYGVVAFALALKMFRWK